MGALFEDRLENVVDPGTIGIGETVEIKTRMGVPVATGEVSASTPFGLALKEGGFYQRDIHLFVPVIEELPPAEAVNAVFSSPDEKVAAKLRLSGQSAPMFEMDKISDVDGRDDDGKGGGKDSSGDKDSGEEDNDEDSKKDSKKDSKSKSKGAAVDTDDAIDVDQLPDDIKKAVTSSENIGDEELNGVLGDIGDSAVKAMKRVGIDETELYDLAAKIQKATKRILTTSSSDRKKEK